MLALTIVRPSLRVLFRVNTMVEVFERPKMQIRAGNGFYAAGKDRLGVNDFLLPWRQARDACNRALHAR